MTRDPCNEGAETKIRQRVRRRLARVAAAGLLLLAAWLGLSLLVARGLTGRHRDRFEEPPPQVAWARFEPVRLRSGDGHELGAWYHRGRDDRPAVVFLHGNGGSRRNCLDRAEVFAADGCTLLLVTLRAHGDSTGDYNDIGFGARLDVVAAVESLEASNPRAPIVVHGISLGSAAATFASRLLGNRVAGYILESPYADLRTAVWNRLELALPRWLGGIAYRGLVAVTPLVVPHIDEIAPREAIGGVPEGVPVLILAGGLDRMARPEEARALYDRVASHGRLVVFERADHTRMFRVDPGRYRLEIRDFLGKVDGWP